MLRKVHGDDVALFALCHSNADVVLATEVNATDIVSRPYVWHLITRRATRAVKAHDTLVKLRQAREQMDRMNTTVVAEGVETEQQLQMLRDWGSQECQGFLFCPPISGEEFKARFA